MLVLITSYLLLVFVLPVALSGVISYRTLPRGRACTACGGETIAILQPHLRRLARLPHPALQRRWCINCGWEGLVRPGRVAEPAVAQAARPPEARATTVSGAMAAAPTHTLDVRALTVDGSPWRVMLQCWNDTGHYYGRFVFVGPSGRLWLDAVEAFNGSTHHDVLGQALALPDGLLTHRLRRLVRDC